MQKISKLRQFLWRLPCSSRLAIELDNPGYRHHENIIHGDSHSQQIIQHCSSLAPFDLLFLDGDKSYDGLRKDYYDYAPMVSKGGVIAFHDAIPIDGNGSTIITYEFIEELKVSGIPFQTIGSVLGIAYCYK